MSTSDGHVSQAFFFMIVGRWVPQSSLYRTRAAARSKDEWNFI
jgi:hypothetical protein